jgi:hypothetical protein
MMTAIEKIRSEIDRDVFDYTQLMSVLQDYKKPRDTVTRLIEQRKIIRIKKGLYIFGELWKRSNYSLESLAGLIHGPSAISLDYALSWFGLIPERVYVVTSISTGRSRKFTTPIGDFSYRQLSHERFSVGLELRKNNSGNWFMAEPLKALADKVWCDPRCRPGKSSYFKDYLFYDLRMDELQLKSFISETSVYKITNAYQSQKINYLFDFLLTENS